VADNSRPSTIDIIKRINEGFPSYQQERRPSPPGTSPAPPVKTAPKVETVTPVPKTDYHPDFDAVAHAPSENLHTRLNDSLRLSEHFRPSQWRGNVTSINAILDTPEKDFKTDLAKLPYHRRTDDISRFKMSLAASESGKRVLGFGNYDEQGPVIQSGHYSGERAQGLFQVMPGNFKEWGKQSADWLESKGYAKEIAAPLRHLTEKSFKNPRLQELLVTSRIEGLREGASEFGGKKQSFSQIAHSWIGHGESDGYIKSATYTDNVMRDFAKLGGKENLAQETRVAMNAAPKPGGNAAHSAGQQHTNLPKHHRTSKHYGPLRTAGLHDAPAPSARHDFQTVFSGNVYAHQSVEPTARKALHSENARNPVKGATTAHRPDTKPAMSGNTISAAAINRMAPTP
jgi:hypothetical protein